MLLRAHPLVRTDIIRGPMFGRHFTFSTVEYQHPLRQMITGGIAAAAFVDAAQAWNGLGGLEASPFQVDAGVGLRVRLPSDAGSVRLDVAHGLRDGNFAFSVGWSSSDSTVVNRRVRR
jgi:outer membrane translocation and assembly module TamA